MKDLFRINNGTHPAIVWDTATENSAWVRGLFTRGNPNEWHYLKPALQNAIRGRNLKDVGYEIENDLRQHNVSTWLGNSLLSKTLQYFVLCTKVYAATQNMTSEMSPARFSMSVMDKTVERQRMWELMRHIAPNSFSVIAPANDQYKTFTKQVPTWLSVLESAGFNLRF